MKISDLELYLVQVPRSGSDPPVRSLLVRLASDSGLEGWGEAPTNWRPTEVSARHALIVPSLVGRSVFNVEELVELDVVNVESLRSAIEIALWDVIGRAAGQPLCHLMGGVFREWVPLAVRLPAEAPQEMPRVAQDWANRGFHVQIVSSSGNAAADLETLAAVRDMAGDRAEWRLDCRGQFAFDAARELCTELSAAGLQFVMDPLSKSEHHQMAALRRQISVPLALSRSIHGPADVLTALRTGSADYVVVDLGRVAGLSGARKCAIVAAAGNVRTTLGESPSVGISVAAMLQLAAATPNLANGNECSYHDLVDDVLAEPLHVSDGMLQVPQGPGLGVEVDRRKVERFLVT